MAGTIRFRDLSTLLPPVDLLTGAQPERALRRTDEALAPWRGRPFTPVSDELWARPAAARLEELHGQVRERRIEGAARGRRPAPRAPEQSSRQPAAPDRRVEIHLGLAAPAAGASAGVLQAFSRGRRMLLLLDNCEHVLDEAAALVDTLLVEGTELAALCTSREPVDGDGDGDGEVVWSLAPLSLPAAASSPTDVRDSAAVTLFLERLDAADCDLGASVAERAPLRPG